MKKLLLVLILSFIIIGCSRFQTKSVILSDGSSGFTARCNGTSNDWATCYTNANIQCKNEFNIVDRELVTAGGFIYRTLYFSCK